VVPGNLAVAVSRGAARACRATEQALFTAGQKPAVA
jgi:hypothetical protein